MPKKFNTTGVCIPKKHFMADVSEKVKQVVAMIEQGDYFAINRPRQYGKTTMLYLLFKYFQTREDYLVFKISFEGIGKKSYDNEALFGKHFLQRIAKSVKLQNKELAVFIEQQISPSFTMGDLSNIIFDIVQEVDKKIILFIDEIDTSLNNQTFLDFLGVLREKYLAQQEEIDVSFHSVILAGVHDVKTLKRKIRSDSQSKYNSPWNIAADFNVEMSLSVAQIESMLIEYSEERKVQMNTKETAKKLLYYTSGHPFLVTKLCQLFDENILPQKIEKNWLPEDLQKAIKFLIDKKNINFKSLTKNLENHPDLYQLVEKMLIHGERFTYNRYSPVIELGSIFGIFKNGNGLNIHNKIYEQVIYDYMSSKLEIANSMKGYNFREQFINSDNSLNVEKILLKFQQFMKEQHSDKDQTFLERHGRLVFLAFLKPIINGQGYDFKEPQISQEKRLDIVLTFFQYQYILELKIWKGKKLHEKGLLQLHDYLEAKDENKGYLLIFDFRKNKPNKSSTFKVKGKRIYTVWV